MLFYIAYFDTSCDPFDGLIVDEILISTRTAALATGSFEQHSRLAEACGLQADVITPDEYNRERSYGGIDRDDVHRLIWQRLKKRGDTLKRRRRDKQQGAD